MKYRLSNISILQTSKVFAILYAIIGLCFLPFACVFLVLGRHDPEILVTGIMYLLGPILYAVIGFIFVAIGAWIYNLVADRVGGVEFDLEDLPGTTSIESVDEI